MPVRQVRVTDEAVAPLLAGLASEYARRYGPVEVMSDAAPEEFEAPAGAFVVLTLDAVTVAGGGFRRLTADSCEVKRMWTSPQHRRRGHASAVLRALEGVARDRGYARIRLETGPAQPEALGLYRRFGYREVPGYGNYEVATAFERALGTAGRR